MIENLNDLREALSAPSEAVADGLARTEGDLMLLGAGGKIGPGLAVMARRALDARGSTARVIAVARTLSGDDETFMKQAGVEIVRADLLDHADLARLPEAERVVYLAGRKFGTHGSEPGTWALNTYLPGRVMRRFPASRVVAFSTGNVYPLVR